MCREIGNRHVAAEDEGDRPRISADEQRYAAEDFDRSLHPQNCRHWRPSRREPEEFLQAMLDKQKSSDDAQDAECVGSPFLQ